MPENTHKMSPAEWLRYHRAGFFIFFLVLAWLTGIAITVTNTVAPKDVAQNLLWYFGGSATAGALFFGIWLTDLESG